MLDYTKYFDFSNTRVRLSCYMTLGRDELIELLKVDKILIDGTVCIVDHTFICECIANEKYGQPVMYEFIIEGE